MVAGFYTGETRAIFQNPFLHAPAHLSIIVNSLQDTLRTTVGTATNVLVVDKIYIVVD